MAENPDRRDFSKLFQYAHGLSAVALTRIMYRWTEYQKVMGGLEGGKKTCHTDQAKTEWRQTGRNKSKEEADFFFPTQ